MPSTTDSSLTASVIGGGVIGLAVASSLARRGHLVTLYDQFDLDHTVGSSHGQSRIFRLSYPAAQWIELARLALHGWRELERTVGVHILRPTGMIEFGDSSLLHTAELLKQSGHEADVQTSDEAATRHDVTVPAKHLAVWQPDAGVLAAREARHALARVAREHGARIELKTPITRPEACDGELVVITAGWWTKDLVRSIGVELAVESTLETVGYFDLSAPIRLPILFDFDGDAPGIYALPETPTRIKVGIHKSGRPLTTPTRSPDGSLVERMRRSLLKALPNVDLARRSASTCVYTSTHDDRFIIRRDGRYLTVSACSGHAFKFAPALGEIIADKVENTEAPESVSACFCDGERLSC